jgi:hypothetical protein
MMTLGLKIKINNGSVPVSSDVPLHTCVFASTLKLLLCLSESPVIQPGIEAPAGGRSDRGWLLPQRISRCRRESGWLLKGRCWLCDYGRLVVPETTSKTNGRCHGDGDSHKNAHCVSLVFAER